MKKLLRKLPTPASVLVRDVGQASFVTLVDNQGREFVHFDVGAPTSFNKHTFPKPFAHTICADAIVILSHWDWDHLHGAHLWPDLLKCNWIVPNQIVGPGAARLALQLKNSEIGRAHV